MNNTIAAILPTWRALHRLIASHFPPIQLFESVVDPDDRRAYAIEALTNDRLLDEAGQLALVPQAERIGNPGSSPVMAAFTHIEHASRFTDGTYGVYYGAWDIDTALAETIHHRQLF